MPKFKFRFPINTQDAINREKAEDGDEADEKEEPEDKEDKEKEN